MCARAFQNRKEALYHQHWQDDCLPRPAHCGCLVSQGVGAPLGLLLRRSLHYVRKHGNQEAHASSRVHCWSLGREEDHACASASVSACRLSPRHEGYCNMLRAESPARLPACRVHNARALNGTWFEGNASCVFMVHVVNFWCVCVLMARRL